MVVRSFHHSGMTGAEQRNQSEKERTQRKVNDERQLRRKGGRGLTAPRKGRSAVQRKLEEQGRYRLHTGEKRRGPKSSNTF